MPVTVRFDPTLNSLQAQIILDATELNDGVMTKAQARKLASLNGGALQPFTVDTLPLASSMDLQQVWLTDMRAAVVSNSSQWWLSNRRVLDRFLGRLYARGVENIWAMTPEQGGANIGFLGGSGDTLAINGAYISITPIYPAAVESPLSLIGNTKSANASPLQTAEFTWTASFIPLALGDDANGFNSFGWASGMFVDSTSTGVLRFVLEGEPVIASAPGAIKVGSSYLIHLSFDGSNFSLYLNGRLVGSAAGSPDFGTGAFYTNFGDGNDEVQSEAYGYAETPADIVAADFQAWSTPAG